MSITLFMIIGGVIIVGLAMYAGYLFAMLHRQNKHQQETLASLGFEVRNDRIFDSVVTLCAVGIQGQCDLSEICIRLYSLVKCLQGSRKLSMDDEFPSISELYHIVKDMSRAEERQALPKNERMKQNLKRLKAESRLADDITEELTRLKQKALDLKELSPQLSEGTIK